MNSKKTLFNLLLLILFLAAIPVLIVVVQKVVELRSRAAGSGTMALSRVGTTPITTSTASFDVQIYVYTGGTAVKSRGVDIVLTYPANLLQLQSIMTDAANSTALKLFAPVNATTYDFDAAAVIAAANSSGTLSFGALPVIKISPLPPSPTPPFAPGTADSFTGSIQLATLRFKPLAAGNAAINLSHAVNNRNDSNIAGYDIGTDGNAVDLLNSVTNLTVNIGGTATATPTGDSCTNGGNGNLSCDTTGLINEADLSIILRKWAPSGPVPTPGAGQRSADIAPTPLDGFVNEADLSKLLRNWKTQ